MFYYNKKSRKKIIHTAECFHVYNVDINDIGWFEAVADAYNKGYRFCKHCNPLIRMYNNESRQINDYCRENGLSYNLGNKSIVIYSIDSMWQITLDKNSRIILYHKNDFKTNKDHLSEINGYHLQGDAKKDSILDYLKYIVEHDFYRMHNPIFINKKKKASPPPKKGTKRYKSELKKIEKYERKKAIKNVVNLIDSLSAI